jgi:hypothetical protein
VLIEHRYELRGPRPAPFALYGALSRAMPEAHGAGWTIAPCHLRSGFVIRGVDVAPDPRAVTLGGRDVPVRIVESAELHPARELWSPLIVIKLTVMPTGAAEFRAAIKRHVRERCAALGVVDVELGAEREIRVHGRRVRGFEVTACADDAEAAARLLAVGLGGKRSMGCGVFHDVRSPWR